jgi:hypothetical protein
LASRTAVEKKNRKRKQQGKGQFNEVMPLVSRPAMVGKKKKRKKHGEDATADPKQKQENRQGNIPADLRTHSERKMQLVDIFCSEGKSLMANGYIYKS